MDQLMLKYHSLSASKKKEVEDFIDFMLTKEEKESGFNIKAWQKKINELPEWTPEDLKVYEESPKSFENWKIQQW